jgi:tetratricopeptide (TPR) repeat protein
VLYARQAPARRATHHRRRAEQLEQVFAATLDDVTTELALHFEKGADWPRAVKYLRRAADLAASRGVLEEASVNLQHALEVAERLPLSERSLAETGILNELADMYLGTFDPRAVDVLTLLRERAARYGLVDVEAKALVDLAYPLAWGSRERGLEVIEEALGLSYAQAEPLFRARIRAPGMMRRIWTRGWSADDATEGARELAGIRRHGTEQDAAWHVIDGYVVGLFSSAYRTTIRELVEALATLTRAHGGSTYLSYAHSVREFIVPWCRILLGEWGEALRELDTGISMAEKNGDPFRAQTLLLTRALALLLAMDFAAVRAICDSLLPALEHPGRGPWRRWCLTIGGAAEVGLGNGEAALDRLLTAGEEMDRHAVLGDWYWRLYQRWALTNLWLSTGDLARARDVGELFLAGASATAERTWQALAWEANARIALASGDTRRAQELVNRAVAAIAGVETPVAGWQAHATAADVARALGDDAAATHHREVSGEIVLGLVASLGPKEEDLRRTFLAAPPVAKVLGGSPRLPLDREDRAAAF